MLPAGATALTTVRPSVSFKCKSPLLTVATSVKSCVCNG